MGCAVEIVSDAVQGAQRCLPSRGRALPIAAQHPAAGATDIDPHSVVVVQVDTERAMQLSSFGIDVMDSADSRWHYVTGSGGDGRFVLYAEEPTVFTEDVIPPAERLHDTLLTATFAEIAQIRTADRFSPNAEITIEVRANCYDPYVFSFITGDD